MGQGACVRHADGLQHAAPENPAIECLRGAAAIMVVASHYAHMVSSDPGLLHVATTGVNLFFVLSGFVFAPYFMGKPLHLAAHGIRRFFRLYPLYVVALLTYAALKWPDPAAWQHMGRHLWMGHTLAGLDVAFFYNPAFWSLPPEVEFYLALPLLAWCSRRWGLWPVTGLALFMHGVLVACAVPGDTSVTPRAIATVHLPGVLIQFVLGVWAYRLSGWLAQPGSVSSQGRVAPSHQVPIMWSLGGALGLMASLLALYNHAVVPGPAHTATLSVWITGNLGLWAAVCHASVVVVAVQWASTHPPCGWAKSGCLVLGQLSYGLYLFHNAVPQALARWWPQVKGWPMLVASVCGVVGIAYLLHLGVERPMRQWGRHLALRLAA